MNRDLLLDKLDSVSDWIIQYTDPLHNVVSIIIQHLYSIVNKTCVALTFL